MRTMPTGLGVGVVAGGSAGAVVGAGPLGVVAGLFASLALAIGIHL